MSTTPNRKRRPPARPPQEGISTDHPAGGRKLLSSHGSPANRRLQRPSPREASLLRTPGSSNGLWLSQPRPAPPFAHKSKIPLLVLWISLCWVFIAAHGLSVVVVIGSYSSLPCAGFSLWWLLLLRSTSSRRAGFSSCGSRARERSLSSCGAWA